ncbi:MAG: C-terminal binding protein [Candidatus Tectomicrobia bacterium]|nr:C-terminal binding protein [Candidatus Tectomicrobia bacterium]
MASDRPKVVLTDYVWESLAPEEDLFRSLGADFVAIQCKSREELLEVARGAHVLLNTYFGPLDRRLMEALPSLKMIARYGIGVDTIDVEAATDHGVLVTNNPTYCLEEVAEHTLALLLSLARKVPFYDRQVRQGKWDVEAGKPLHRLSGKTLGLLGLGNIARRVAQRAKGFKMRLLYHDPFLPAEAGEKEGAEAAPLERVLSESDYVSIHVPLNQDTRHLIGEERLRLMKPTACLINASRGPIVSTDALVKALSEGWIAGAALDVIEEQPPLSADHPLFGFPQVVITPHTAWYSEEALVGLHHGAPSEVARFLRGERPLHVVNPQVLEKTRP